VQVETVTSTPVLKKYQGLFSLATLGLMVCVFTVTDKLIVAVSGVIVMAVLVWGFIEIRRSKNVDAKTKQSAWYVLVVLISVAAIVYFKLS